MIPLPETEVIHTVMPDDYRYGHVRGFTRSQMLAYGRACAAEWKDAIDAELVTIESTVDSFPTPRKAIQALIEWHVQVALDPAVSSDARALIKRGAALAESERTGSSDELGQIDPHGPSDRRSQ